MNQVTIPNLDDRVVQRLKQMAWQKGLPLEESLRQLLVDAALRPKADEDLTARMGNRAVSN